MNWHTSTGSLLQQLCSGGPGCAKVPGCGSAHGHVGPAASQSPPTGDQPQARLRGPSRRHCRGCSEMTDNRHRREEGPV